MEIFSERGGVAWGTSRWARGNVSWPFAKFTITRDHLESEIIFAEDFYFERENVKEIRIEKVIWSKGIRIYHTKQDYPEYICFGPRNLEFTKATLEQFGYSVQE